MLRSAADGEARRDGGQTRWIALRLGVATHVGIRIHAAAIPLYRIRREEDAHHWVIVPGSIVVQPRQRVVVLAGEALGGVECAGGVTGVAVGTVKLVTLMRGTSLGNI
jgi:hypothetical protein